ncbi:MAG: hypothetical protein KAU22_08605 [Desulfuromonadales bacterium]|nr:hypothetical protein [Desulfuromonadales bacterium]
MNTTSTGKKVKSCAACGKETKEIIETGSVILCRQCVPDIRVVVDQLRAAKKPVNMVHIARRIYRKKHSAGNYLLRDIPKELWDRAKHRAIDDGDSLRDLILKSLNAYLGP